MNLLLDTIVFDSLLRNPSFISSQAFEQIENLDNTLSVSIVSVWELAIQISRKKIAFTAPLDDIVKQALQEYSLNLIYLSLEDMLENSQMPFVDVHGSTHKDPFDRLIIAQAKTRNFPVVTSDSKFSTYSSITVVW